jgi:hypothetical protein
MTQSCRIVRYSDKMWVLCSSEGAEPGRVVPLVYRGCATMWFSDEAGARTFMESLSSFDIPGLCVAPIVGLEALHRWAEGLLSNGIQDIFFDLSPRERTVAESLGEFVDELSARLKGSARSTQN